MKYNINQIDEMSEYMLNTYWESPDKEKYSIRSSGTITYNYDPVFETYNRIDEINEAFSIWTKITGYTFERNVNGNDVNDSSSHLNFRKNTSGELPVVDSGTVSHFKSGLGVVNGILEEGSITFHPYDIAMFGFTHDEFVATVVHEIGHFFGLGHPGNYNGDLNASPTLPLDSHQLSIMSYISPTDNLNVTGGEYEHSGLMMADIYSVREKYSLSNIVGQGDTLYDIVDYMSPYHYYTIYDNDGIDTIERLGAFDKNGSSVSEMIDIRQGHSSSINGEDTNLFIAFDTVIENVYTLIEDDTVFGNSASNEIKTRAGNDVVFSNGGQDTIYGGYDNDRLYGGTETDTNNNGIFGEVYIDQNGETIHETENLHYSDPNNASVYIYGEGGNDYITGGRMQDGLYGGSGQDTIVGSVASDVIFGDDSENLKQGDDLLYGQGGNDSIYGGKGDDQLNGGSGNDSLFGGDNMDIIIAEEGNDVLNGDSGNDFLFGGSWSDELYGGSDNDILRGEKGNDYLYGGSGNDHLYGGEGVDNLYGGAGTDYFVFRFDENTRATVHDFSSLEGDIILIGWNDASNPTWDISGSGNITTFSLEWDGGTSTLTVHGLEYDPLNSGFDWQFGAF